MEPQPQDVPSLGYRIFMPVLKIVLAVALLVGGFVLGTYAATPPEEQDQHAQKETTSVFPDSYYGVSATGHGSGTLLYVLDPPNDVKANACGDTPSAVCKGSLYTIAGSRLKKVASDVLGRQVIHYEPGVRALLQNGSGDGSCRQVKYYIYDFSTASSSLSFSAFNDCDGSDERNDQYQKEIDDYLAQFGL